MITINSQSPKKAIWNVHGNMQIAILTTHEPNRAAKYVRQKQAELKREINYYSCRCRHPSLKNWQNNQLENKQGYRTQWRHQPIGSNQHLGNASPNDNRIYVLFKQGQNTSQDTRPSRSWKERRNPQQIRKNWKQTVDSLITKELN